MQCDKVAVCMQAGKHDAPISACVQRANPGVIRFFSSAFVGCKASLQWPIAIYVTFFISACCRIAGVCIRGFVRLQLGSGRWGTERPAAAGGPQ